jgi:hypothetical protein
MRQWLRSKTPCINHSLHVTLSRSQNYSPAKPTIAISPSNEPAAVCMLFAAPLDVELLEDLVVVEDIVAVARPLVEEAEPVGLSPDAVAEKLDDVTKFAHARRVLFAKWMTNDLSPM